MLARRAAFGPVTVTRYGKTATIHAEAITCLWHGVFGPRRVQVLLIRDVSATGYDLALVTTDLDASPAAVIERYASRWSIEVAIEDARQVFGAGQPRTWLRPGEPAPPPYCYQADNAVRRLSGMIPISHRVLQPHTSSLQPEPLSFWSARGRSVSLGADTYNKVFCAGVVRPELDSSSIAAGRRWRSRSMERHYEVLIPYGS